MDILWSQMSLSRHFSRASNPSYIFGLGLTAPEFYFRQDKPGHFKVVSQAGAKAKHYWSHEDGGGGAVSSKELVKNWKDYTSSDPVYGSVMGVDGESHLLFKYKGLKLNKKGNLVAFGKLHNHDYIQSNHDLLRTAHGGGAIENHIKHDSNARDRSLIQSDRNLSDAKSERRFDPEDGVGDGRGPLGWGIGSCWFNCSPKPEPSPEPSPSPLPDPIAPIINPIIPTPPPAPTPKPSPTHIIGGIVGHIVNPSPAPIQPPIINPLPPIINPLPVPINPIPGAPKRWVNNITEVGGAFTATTSAAWKQVKSAVGKFVDNSSSTSLPFSYTWSVPDLEKSFGPIDANLSITPTLKGLIDFGGGLSAAAAFQSYVPDIRSTLTADVNGNISAGKFTGTKPLGVSGPGAEASTDFGSVGIDTGISALLSAEAKGGDEITGQLFSIDAGFSPSATLNIIDGHFQPSFDVPTPTVDISGFQTNVQDFDGVIARITPYVKASGTVKVPKEIPFVGGDTVASIDFGVHNSIVLNSSTTQGISNTIEGVLTADVTFMGSSLVDKSITMYGPLSV